MLTRRIRTRAHQLYSVLDSPLLQQLGFPVVVVLVFLLGRLVFVQLLSRSPNGWRVRIGLDVWWGRERWDLECVVSSLLRS